jgi:putative NADH-flavin reductase
LTGRTPVDWTYMSPIFSHKSEKLKKKNCEKEKGQEVEVKSVESLIGQNPADWTHMSPIFFRQIEELSKNSENGM